MVIINIDSVILTLAFFNVLLGIEVPKFYESKRYLIPYVIAYVVIVILETVKIIYIKVTNFPADWFADSFMITLIICTTIGRIIKYKQYETIRNENKDNTNKKEP